MFSNDGWMGALHVNHFSDVSRHAGVDTTAISQGMNVADVDNDGDLDILVSNIGPVPVCLRACAEPHAALVVERVWSGRCLPTGAVETHAWARGAETCVASGSR